MCTVSWLPGPGGYLLCFNRDENRTRRPGLPPTIRRVHGLDIVAPTDADAGGTWIGVNSAGLTVCLANLYGTTSPIPAEPISRGQLVLGLAGERSLSEVARHLREIDFTRYRPFTLIAAQPDLPAQLWRWDGTAVSDRRHDEPGILVTSSAVDQDPVEASRRREYAAMFADGPLTTSRLSEFHSSHRPARGGLSVCMHRPDAQTVSLTRVEVTTDTIAMAYSDGSPCLIPLASPRMAMRDSLRAQG